MSFASPEPTPVDKQIAQQMTNGGYRTPQTNMINVHCNSLSKFKQVFTVLRYQISSVQQRFYFLSCIT